MAEKQKQQMPSPIAGLVRYDQEDKEALIKIRPIHVVGVAAAFIVIEIILLFAIPL